VRALLLEIGSAAGSLEGTDSGGGEDLLRLIKLLVTRILSDYEKDASVFGASLGDLRRYLRARDGGGTEPVEETRVQVQPAAPARPQGPAAPPPRAAQAPERAPASPEFVQLVDKMAPDSWVEIKESGGTRRRIKLFARVARTGQMQFVDEAGARVGEYSRNELASMIEQGDAKILHGSGGGAPGPGRFGRR
jgi:pyruvate/2-oxoglutarate dehydrogenase complex dihydrolipoamide acyltransferase (E2) component